MFLRLAPFFLLLGLLQTALSADGEQSLLKNNLKHRIARDKGLRGICNGDTCKVACRLLILRQNILRAKGSTEMFRATMQHRIINLDAAEGHTSASSHRQGPDFVIIGAQKAGTTALFEDMLVSPRFSFPEFQTENKKSFKEAHFFDHCLGVGTLNTHYYKKPAPDSGYWCDLKLYLDLFKSCGKKTCGDASPSYMIYPEMPLLAHILLPLHTKMIVMLREPLSRAISGFFQMNRHGIPLIFEDSVQMELNVMLQCETDVPNIEERYSECIWPKVVENSLTETLSNASGWWSDSWETTSTPKMCLSNAINHGTTLLRGLYYYQLRDWLETFGADRIMVLLSDTFFKSPVKTTEKAIKYVSQHQSAAYVAAAARQSKRGQNKILASAENATLRNSRTPEDFRISTELQTKLREVYQPYNELLYTLLDKHNIPYTRFS